VSIHHLQLWVPDLGRAERSWGWLLGALGYDLQRSWETGRIWRRDGVGIVIEASPDMVPGMLHSRWRPGMNHVAFQAGTAEQVAEIVRLGPEHGWTQLDADTRHPLPAAMAVAFLEDSDGFEVELVADEPGPA
jgi:catechol 2,3-dioxygenase-like lactoylglutathione lyase family enzyme